MTPGTASDTVQRAPRSVQVSKIQPLTRRSEQASALLQVVAPPERQAVEVGAAHVEEHLELCV